MHVNAKTDYAIRAMVELAAIPSGVRVKKGVIAQAQSIPQAFLENILRDLRTAGLVHTTTGPEGGYNLARDPARITLAEIIRAVEGPLAAVQGRRPDSLSYEGLAEPLVEVWIAVRANLRAVLDTVTLADVVRNELPDHVRRIAADPAAWEPR